MEMEVFLFFLRSFWKGMLIGLVIRFAIALIMKGDVSGTGAIRSALFGGIIYLIIKITQFAQLS